MKALLAIAMLSIPFISPTSYHGLEVSAENRDPFVVVRLTWEGAGPAAGVEIQVYAPGEEEAFQSGTTDPDGLFAFQPRMAGTWRIVADDGTGHRASHEMDISTSFAGGVPLAGPEEAGHSHAEEAGHSHAEEAGHSHAEEAGMHEEEGDHAHEAELPLWMRVVWGLSLIAAIAGFAYGVTARRASTSGN
jgi:hypothetical protein